MDVFIPFQQELVLVVDLDERGCFKARVEDEFGHTVFDLSNEDEETGWPGDIWLVEAGYMRHARDAEGLLEYLRLIGVASPSSRMSISG